MYSTKVIKVIPLRDLELLVFFEDGASKKFDVKTLFPFHPEFEALRNPALFNCVHVEPGGYGISWNEELDCSEGELYEKGVNIPVNNTSSID